MSVCDAWQIGKKGSASEKRASLGILANLRSLATCWECCSENEWYEYYEKYGDMTSISEEQAAEDDDAVTFLFVRMTLMLTSMSV